MCGIVGLYTKSPELEGDLGGMLADMLVQMTDRGPDSAGVAFYHDPVETDQIKVTLQGLIDTDWQELQTRIQGGLDANANLEVKSTHAVLVANASAEHAAS